MAQHASRQHSALACRGRPLAKVRHLHAMRPGRRVPDVADSDDGAVQADADVGVGPVQPRVVRRRGHHVLCRAAGDGAGNEAAHKQTCDGGVAVREVKSGGSAGCRVASGRVAHPRSRPRREPEAAEARKAEGPDIERADRVGADAPLAVAHRLEERERPGVGAGDAQQVVPVAHPHEARLLLVRGQARQIVDRRLVQADNVVAHAVGERRVPQRFAPGALARPRWPGGRRRRSRGRGRRRVHSPDRA